MHQATDRKGGLRDFRQLKDELKNKSCNGIEWKVWEYDGEPGTEDDVSYKYDAPYLIHTNYVSDDPNEITFRSTISDKQSILSPNKENKFIGTNVTELTELNSGTNLNTNFKYAMTCSLQTGSNLKAINNLEVVNPFGFTMTSGLRYSVGSLFDTIGKVKNDDGTETYENIIMTFSCVRLSGMNFANEVNFKMNLTGGIMNPSIKINLGILNLYGCSVDVSFNNSLGSDESVGGFVNTLYGVLNVLYGKTSVSGSIKANTSAGGMVGEVKSPGAINITDDSQIQINAEIRANNGDAAGIFGNFSAAGSSATESGVDGNDSGSLTVAIKNSILEITSNISAGTSAGGLFGLIDARGGSVKNNSLGGKGGDSNADIQIMNSTLKILALTTNKIANNINISGGDSGKVTALGLHNDFVGGDTGVFKIYSTTLKYGESENDKIEFTTYNSELYQRFTLNKSILITSYKATGGTGGDGYHNPNRMAHTTGSVNTAETGGVGARGGDCYAIGGTGGTGGMGGMGQFASNGMFNSDNAGDGGTGGTGGTGYYGSNGGTGGDGGTGGHATGGYNRCGTGGVGGTGGLSYGGIAGKGGAGGTSHSENQKTEQYSEGSETKRHVYRKAGAGGDGGNSYAGTAGNGGASGITYLNQTYSERRGWRTHQTKREGTAGRDGTVLAEGSYEIA